MLQDTGNNSNNANQIPNPYWNVWATLAFTILVFILFSALQSFFLVAYMFSQESMTISDALNPNSASGFGALLNNYAFNGDAISVSQIPAAIIGTALIFFIIAKRKTLSIKNYLEFYPPRLKYLLVFLGLMILGMMLMEGVNIWLDRPTPEFMTKVYLSATNLPLLWIAVGISAPFFEEILFRGFFFEGLRKSAFGTLGAVLLTSACWAIIHVQYGWFEIISIFLIGILLAIAKLKSKSLYVPIAMHMLMNLTASLGMELNL
ncbi:hypothetical protein GCM10009133_07910 [Cocleimonas flava]|uniref:CAAX prenyl protease 2/Lysostaphin resistance protein A-like domain-containing protein n=1 Tax=Cocleimonas flava TaxID=634765 RepID=A0A4V2P8V3_9GAMM|nr:CPBP family intramembrane glutamic endopeptidase [Cocleimonas flava]TCJ87155.1 hypothetical protein EV695_1658 [Cocleimonas flava]